MKTTNLEYTNIPVLLPNIEYFIDKVKNNEPFHFYKINHGMLDSLYFAYENNYLSFQKDLEDKNYELMSKKIQNSFKDKDWGLDYWHGENVDVSKYIEIFLKVFVETSSINPKIHTGISLGVGLHTFWGTYPQNHPTQIGRLEIVQKIFEFNKNPFYYSGIFKHYTIKKEIYQLFNLLNKLEFEVIFFGPDYLSLYKEVFDIKKFHHVNIPVRGAAQGFEGYVNRVKEITNKNDKTVIFHSAGQMLSANLVYELQDTDIWGIDIGRSFDILIKNKVESEPTMYKCWTLLDESKLEEYVDEIRK